MKTSNNSCSYVCRSSQGLSLKASMGPPKRLNNKPETVTEAKNGCDIFKDLKDRFSRFKKNTYM